MAKIIVQGEKNDEIYPLVNDAIATEKRLIQAAIKRTKRILDELEKKYDMPSQDFYEKYQKGEMGDSPDMIDWSGEYKILLKLKTDLKHLEETEICR